MRGIRFETLTPATVQNPNGLDVACFIGLARAREGELPSGLYDWLERSRWLERYTLLGVLQDLPVPLHSWEEFSALFVTTRLDSHAEVSSLALAASLSLPVHGTILHVVVDGVREEVELPAGDIDLSDLATALNEGLQRAEARIDERDGQRYLVLRRLELQQPGAISVFSNPLLGFPVAAKDQNNSLLTYMAGAVRAFFREGGRKCYVIPMAAPEVLDASSADRLGALSQLLWADSSRLGARNSAELATASLHDWAAPSSSQTDWHGPAHLLGLEDVTYLGLPDLPDLVGSQPNPALPTPSMPSNTAFVECTPDVSVPRQRLTQILEPAECDLTAWRAWARLAAAIRDYLLNVRSDLQLLLALPWPNRELRRDLPEVLRNELLPGLADVRLQLTFPWLKTRDSAALPGGCEPPDGALAGLLAHGAVKQGPYRSVAGIPLPAIYDLAPKLPQSIDELENTIARICWFGSHPRGWQLFSDVTTHVDGALRHAAVRRLFLLLARVARNEGWARVFESNGPATWRLVERNLTRLLARIYSDNGLRGRTANDAYSVQCNRSQMTQQDIDTGRLICLIQVQPAIPLNQIVVALSLNELGQVEAREVAA